MKTPEKLKSLLRQGVLRSLGKLADRGTLSPEEVDSKSIQRIIVIHPHGNLHDLLLALPAIRAIWQGFPNAHRTVLTKSEFVPVLAHSLYIDEVIGFKRKFEYRALPKQIGLVGRLRSNYDLAIVLNTGPRSLISDLLAFATRADYILGSENSSASENRDNYLYNLVARYSTSEKHQVERILEIVRHIGLDTKDLSESIYCTRDEKQEAIEFFTRNKVKPGNTVVALWFGSCLPAENAWPVENFVKIAKHFRKKHHARIVVSWGPAQAEFGKNFLEKLDFKPIKVTDGDFRELAAKMYFCHAVITNDLDFTHLTASVGTPVVALFGETDPRRWKPIGQQFMALKSENGSNTSISADEVIRCAETVIHKYPKSLRLDFQDFDISDQVLEGYLAVVEKFED